MKASWTRVAYLAAALTVFAVIGCGDSTGSSNAPADDVTGDIGITFRDEVEGALNALTLSTSLDPIGTTQAPTTATAFSAIPCVTPSSAADNDGDGVPDNATFTFTAPPCRFTGWRGGTLEIVGQLLIQDPDPTSAGFGYEATLTDLLTRFITAGNAAIYDVRRNGTRTVSGSTDGLLLTANLQVKRSFAGHPDAAIDKQWAVTYTPATPLQINQGLPSGSLDIAGTATWDREADEHFELILTTPTPLVYEASCTDTVQRIKSGELHAAGTFNGMDGFVRVRWNECGKEPSYSFEAAPAT